MAEIAGNDEAAAIAAAIGRFEAETTAVVADGEAISPWHRAALIEGVGAKVSIQDLDEGGSKWLS
jgi:hypothetical protein